MNIKYLKDKIEQTKRDYYTSTLSNDTKLIACNRILFELYTHRLLLECEKVNTQKKGG